MNPDIYSSEERLEIAQARSRAYSSGRPEIVQRINALLDAEAPFSQIRKLWAPKVKAEVPVAPEVESSLEPPPMAGAGSGTNAWRAFALQVSDMAPEVIESMGKMDIVTVLKDKGIIE